jgi:predicted ATPase
MMIKSVQFDCFRVLRNATLPLGPVTLLAGANGSGKSTALKALSLLSDPTRLPYEQARSLTASADAPAEVSIHWGPPHEALVSRVCWQRQGGSGLNTWEGAKTVEDAAVHRALADWVARIRSYSLDAVAIGQTVSLDPATELGSNGCGLAVVLDQLRDTEPERFEALNSELGRWMPEFDRILFETPGQGQRAFSLRTRKGRYKVPAADLSQGVLLSLAVLTLAYLPNPPTLACFEEPDRGIHPRLLAHLREAFYRLAYPREYGESRDPVQVIATTHNPYLLDLFKERPRGGRHSQ